MALAQFDSRRVAPDGDLAPCAASLKPGEWSDCGTGTIPLYLRSQINALDQRFADRGNNGPHCVIDALTDAAWDAETMYFHGGGDFCYAGSEWYAFHVPTLTWKRLGESGVFRFGEQLIDARMQSRKGLIGSANGSPFNPWVYSPDYPPLPENFTLADIPFPLGRPLPEAGAEGVSVNPTHSYAAMAFDPHSGEIYRFGGLKYYPPGGAKGLDWRYYAPLDPFVGYADHEQPVWFHRIADTPQIDPDRVAAEAAGLSCSDAVRGWQCPNLQELVNYTPSGGTLALAKGLYRQCATVDRPITIDGDGSIIEKSVCRSKGAFVARADLVLIGVECRNHGSGNDNLACIRRHTNNITLRRVYCHDSSTCIVGGKSRKGKALAGEVLIEDSRFERLGGDRGKSHGLYLNNVDTVTVRRSTFSCMLGEGHHLKTGARKTIVEDVTFDSADCVDSRHIDAFAGGELIIRDSSFAKGPSSANRDMIAWVPSGGPPSKHYVAYSVERIEITGTRFDCGRAAIVLLVGPGVDPEIVWRDNVTAGGCRRLPE